MKNENCHTLFELIKHKAVHHLGLLMLLMALLPGLSCKSSTIPVKSNDDLPVNSAKWSKLTKKDQKFLDMVERKAFEFFWDGFDPVTGLIGDASSESRRSSIASVGFGLSAYCIADARGWENHQEVYKRVLTILNSFYKDTSKENDFCVEGTHGFFYHFVNMDTGKRFGKSEVSTIDTAILMAGILNVLEHFKGTEIEDLARKIYLTAEWDWFLQKDGGVAGSWSPEKGISGEFKGYNEYILVYLLGLGSPTHPAPESSWDVWASTFKWIKPYEGIDSFLTGGGRMKPLAYLYQFPACWYDFRGKKDKYADYWGNGVNALKANKRFSNEWGSAHGYPDEMWGWTACAGKNRYLGFSAPFDGTIAPSAVAASIPFIPEMAIPSLKYMYQKYSDKIWGKYGFVDSFNPSQEWYDDGFLGIDKGNEVLMLENFRSGFIWQEFMKNPYVMEGMKKAKFDSIK